MAASLPRRKLPIAYLVDEQIAYVTDNEKDAEALSSRTECPVVLTRRELPVAASRSVNARNQTSETLRRSRRLNAQGVYGTADSLNVSGAWESQTPQNNSDVSSALDASDVSDTASVQSDLDFQTFQDVPDVADATDVSASDL